MVRRRARATKLESTAAADQLLTNGLAAAGVLLEDQYFASPKRKDCKIDNGMDEPDCAAAAAVVNQIVANGGAAETNNTIVSKTTRSAAASTVKTKNERGGINGRVIGVPLATRSQVRTIENFFKANTAAKTAKIEHKTDLDIEKKTTKTKKNKSNKQKSSKAQYEEYNNSNDIAHSQQQQQQQQSATHPELIFELSEDTNTDTDTTELSDETATGGGACGGFHFGLGIDFSTHRSPLRDSHSSHSSSVTDNIFLQEPVLSLNVDKTPNQASSIKINKTLEIEPIFSSPPTQLTTACSLNGRFNQIVSLNGIGSPSMACELGGGGGGMQHVGMNGFNGAFGLLPDNDNSSCDSGIAFASSLDNNNTMQQRRRKPATPHRIVCPSPIKSTSSRKVSPINASPAAAVGNARKMAAAKEQLSPRKSPRQLAAVTSKTRRRLNQQKEQQAPFNAKQLHTNAAYKQQFSINEDIVAIEDDEAAVIVEIDDDDDDEDPVDQEYENLAQTNQTTQQQQQQQQTQNKQQLCKTTAKILTNGCSGMLPKSAQHQRKLSATMLAPKALAAQQPLAITNGNREMTEFFPVRRSVRKTKTAVKEEMMRSLEQAILEERAEGLKIEHFECKGRGIVSDRRFQRGEFVVEYVGDLISMTEAVKREQQYALDKNKGCYMYYFKHKNQQYCIDATEDTGKLGRLVNHSRNGNLITKVVVVKQKPHLILIAKDDIEAGEELTYDYGDRSKLSLLHHPWLAF